MTLPRRLPLDAPIAHLPARLQAAWVDRLKRRAVARARGRAAAEARVLEVYLWAEEWAEAPIFDAALATDAPAWLARRMARHRADEARHAELLRQRLAALGAEPGHIRGGVDLIARWKARRLAAIAERSAQRFTAGRIAPLLAIAWRMEAMGVRVLGRHVDVLRAAGDDAPLRPLLEAILRDERGHAEGCRRALERLVPEVERPALIAVVAEVDAVDRAFGVTSAVAMWLAVEVARRRGAPRARSS